MENKMIPVVMSSMPPYEEYIDEIRDLWDSRILTHQGAKYWELEEKLTAYLGVDHLSMFANGHLALELALNALRLTGEISGEVITTPYTFTSTTQAIVRNGLTPVFCDIKPDDYTIDPQKIESLITEKTTAIVPVHVYGSVCDVYAIDRIAKKYNLKVIYDAAHVFGVKINGTPIGCFGDMTMFSFHATKVYHTVEGGGVAYKDEKYRPLLTQLRQFGMDGQIEVPIVGTNAKMTEMHAAMGLCNLRHIDEEIAKRGKAYNRYIERLKDIDGIRICVPKDNVTPNYAYFPVVFDGQKFNRDQVADRLAANHIFARKYFFPITSTYKAYQGLFPIQETPVAKQIGDSVLTLPLYADLSVEDVDRICGIILQKA